MISCIFIYTVLIKIQTVPSKIKQISVEIVERIIIPWYSVKMAMKRSAAVSELESQLQDKLTLNGEIEVSWVGKLVELMRETQNLDGRVYLLKIIRAMSTSATITRFIQYEGLQILSDWITEHQENNEIENLTYILSAIVNVDFPHESIRLYNIRDKIKNLTNHVTTRVADLSRTILSKWESAGKAEPPKNSQPSKVPVS